MGHHTKRPLKPKLSTKEKLISIKKAKKEKLKEKRARLVVRNLPFQATEEKLKEFFEMFGEIDDVKILKKEDGKLKGCAFVQFKQVQKAKKARHHTNGHPFMGREITVDFALAKDKYEETVKVKQENGVGVKEEPIDAENVEVKSEDESTAEEEDNDEEKSSDNEEDGEKQPDEEDEESESDEEDGEEEKDDEDQEMKEPNEKRPRFESNDAEEGKTVFVKNVPYSATNEELKQCMEQFGPIQYTLICIDKYTEHSRGTAFVKFHEKEDAEKAMAAGTELTLLGNVLDCQKALSRRELQQRNVKNVRRDSRNLYLAKEGVILAGTKAARGVSSHDMMKRLELEKHKLQMLRNLRTFVSRDRLAIHNIPPHWDDAKLLQLIKKYSPETAEISSARIIRDMKYLNAEGLGRSKGFAFVKFSKHEDALATLRALNNNPKIFTPYRRPIVSFAIGNSDVVHAARMRNERSRLNNPNCKDYDPTAAKNIPKAKAENASFMGVMSNQEEEKDEEKKESFVGVTAKPGAVQKMRSKFNLKTQAKLHLENVKKEKKKQKFTKKTLKDKEDDFTKQPKQKINNKEDEDNVSKLVNNYKKKLSTPETKKSKWYNEDE